MLVLDPIRLAGFIQKWDVASSCTSRGSLLFILGGSRRKKQTFAFPLLEESLSKFSANVNEFRFFYFFFICLAR
jgi:hypothetical protein